MTDEILQTFQLDRDMVWTGNRKEVLASDGAEAGWAIAPEPPATAPGERLRWDGAWTVLSADHLAAMLRAAKKAALAEIASQRWEATQFFTYDGVRTQADGAIGVVTGRLALRDATGAPPELQMKFKLGDGEYRYWSRDQDTAFGVSIGLYIQMCFNIEDELTEAVQAAADVDQVAQLVAAARSGWPT